MSSGDEFFKKAEGKINAFFFKDYEAGYENFIKAAGCYKAEKQWREAGEAFMRAGDIAMKLKNPGDACSAYTDCAKALKKIDSKKAAAAMDQAVKLNIENNRLGPAARLLKEWAEALESEENYEEALKAYTTAIKYFNAEEQPQAAQQCHVRMATMYVSMGRYVEAMKAYETLGFKYLEGSLKSQAKEQFFRAFICRLATITPDSLMEGCEQAKDALDTYIAADGYFRNTRESDACQLLLEAMDEGNEEKFDEAVGNLQQLRMLDDVKVTILTKVRTLISDTR